VIGVYEHHPVPPHYETNPLSVSQFPAPRCADKSDIIEKKIEFQKRKLSNLKHPAKILPGGQIGEPLPLDSDLIVCTAHHSFRVPQCSHWRASDVAAIINKNQKKS